MTLIDAIAVLALLVLPLAVGVVIATCCLPRPLPTRPICRGCRARLDPLAATGLTACPTCAREREPNEPSTPDRTRPRPILLVASLLVVLAGAGGFAMSRTEPWRTRLAPRPDEPPTASLFATALRLQTRPALPLAELTLRQEEGEDVAGIAASAVSAAFDAQPPGQPLMTGAAEEIAAIALLGLPARPAPSRDPAFAERVLRMLYVEPTVTPQVIDGTTSISVAATGAQRLTPTRFARIWRVQRVLLDGTELPIDLTATDGITEAPWLGIGPRARAIPVAFPPVTGTHRLRVECEALLYTPFDTKRLRDHTGTIRPREDWPQPLARLDVPVDIEIELPLMASADDGTKSGAGRPVTRTPSSHRLPDPTAEGHP